MLAHLKRFKDSKSPIGCHAAIYQCKSGNFTKIMVCIKTDAEWESQTAGMIITIIVVVKVSVGAFMPLVSASGNHDGDHHDDHRGDHRGGQSLGRCVHAACVQVRGCWTATWALGGRHLELASLRRVSQAIIICSPSSFPTCQIIIGAWNTNYH